MRKRNLTLESELLRAKKERQAALGAYREAQAKVRRVKDQANDGRTMALIIGLAVAAAVLALALIWVF